MYLFGGCVTSWKVPNGKDLLFVRPDAVFNGKKPIRLFRIFVCAIFVFLLDFQCLKIIWVRFCLKFESLEVMSFLIGFRPPITI